MISRSNPRFFFSISQDFDKVWPIFDSAQSRDFRKVISISVFFYSLPFFF